MITIGNSLWACFFKIFQVIGAEYGEGFEKFRPEGPLKVDVVRFGCISRHHILLSMFHFSWKSALLS